MSDGDYYILGPIELLDGRGVWVEPLTFGRARILLGEIGSPFVMDSW